MASTSRSQTAAAVPHAPATRPLAAAARSADSSTAMNPRSSIGGGDSSSKRKADASSYVFLRIKRRRNEDPVERLVLQQQQQQQQAEAAAAGADSTQDTTDADDRDGDDTASKPRKRPATSSSSSSLLGAFSKLSTQEQKFVFTRIDTLEQHQLADAGAAKWTERLKRKVKALKEEPRAPLRKSTVGIPTGVSAPASQLRAQQQQDRLRERRKSDAQRSRGLSGAAPPAAAAPPGPSIEIKQQQTLELLGVRLVDLETVARPASGTADAGITGDTSGSTASITMNGARLRPTRVLNPSERELDEAIWYAFRENDFSRFFRIFHSQTSESKLNPAAFQRPADGATILMAAALHGRADVIEVVLRSSSASALQQDWEGATAATFAARSGFKNVEAALVACEAAEREKDFVYDVYCVDVSASKEHASSTAGGSKADGVTGEESTPVVAVSAAVQRWLSQDANWKGEDEHVEEYMLESDAENDSDDDRCSISLECDPQE